MTLRFLCLAILLFGAQAGRSNSDPWTGQETMQPEDLAKLLVAGGPQILMVGPRILFNGAHIKGAVYAGPAGKPEGLDNLTKAADSLAKDRPIVLYCGCCPMEKCPNIRPAFQQLKELGYQRVKVLIVPTNLHDDWVAKGYPVEKGDVPSNAGR
jgi:rhodanese-related sulfurtransferase